MNVLVACRFAEFQEFSFVFSVPIIVINNFVASSDTGQRVAKTFCDPAARNADVRPLSGGE